MAVIKRQNICFAQKYTDNQGQEKTSWKKVGTALYNDKGNIILRMDSMPVGVWDGSMMLFDIEENNQQRQSQGGYNQSPPTYNQPAAYNQPATYNQPQQGYGQTQQGYGQQTQSNPQQSQGYGQSTAPQQSHFPQQQTQQQPQQQQQTSDTTDDLPF